MMMYIIITKNAKKMATTQEKISCNVMASQYHMTR